MAAHPKPNGEIVLSLRKEKGMTQELLAESAGVDRRTIQRLESGQWISADNLKAVATALGVTTETLFGTRSITALIELAAEMTCRYCGARVVHCASVDYENVDVDVEVFACGAQDGLTFRPCPKHPRFPKFTDYDLEFHEEGDMIYCLASGKTDMARAVHLEQGFGRTQESAARWVERSYICARDGYEAGEAFYPMTSHL